MKKTDYIVFIGRFQPFHLGHKFIIDNALDEAKKVIVVVGSYRTSLSPKNPWTFEERKELILAGMPKETHNRLIIVPLRDYMYSDLTWITSLQNIVSSLVEKNATVKIIGHFKDDSSIYLTFFPQWPLLKQPNFEGIDGTDIRHDYFRNDYCFVTKVPYQVSLWLDEWKKVYADKFSDYVKEVEFLKEYRNLWKDAPFPVNHVTTDAVVVQSGHILLVRRKINPGKGKLALPGGFVGINEHIFDGCVRELYEETNIDIPKPVMKKLLTDVHVFDHPNRSMRGRIITHAHFFMLSEGGPLPSVKAADDAIEAFWLPLNDIGLHEQEMFSDHIHIIQHFVNVGR